MTATFCLQVGTSLLIDVLLGIERMHHAAAAGATAAADRERGMLRHRIRQHWPLDWRGAFEREHVDAATVRALLDGDE